MKLLTTFCLTIALMCVIALEADAAPTEWFSIGFTGTLDEPANGGNPGDWLQIGPDSAVGSTNGGSTGFAEITSYVASAGLPGLAFNDLDDYGLAMVANVETADLGTRTFTYSGSLYVYAPGYDFDELGQQLEQGTFTATAVFASDWESATINGLVQLQPGALQPAGWPGPVDWSAGGPAYLTATLDNTTGVLTGTIQSVPEPGTIALAGLAGVAGLAIVRRRRQK